MKRIIFLTFFCLLAVYSFGQSPTLTSNHGKVQFTGFVSGGTADVVGDLTAWSDQTNQYFANGIQVGDVLWDNNGNRWEVMVVNSSTLFSANVDLRDINASAGVPVGVGFVSRETPNIGLSLLVPDNNIGISQQLKSRVETHNMLLLDQFTGELSCNETITQTAHGFSAGDLLGQSTGNGDYFVANTNAADSLPVAFVCEVIDANNFKISSEGWLEGTHPFTPGNDYFVQDVAGTLTTTPDAEFHVFGFRAYTGKRYYDIPELVSNNGGGGGGSPDGNGIYSGSGTVPSGTVSTLVNDFDIQSGSTNKMELDSTNIRFTSKGFFTVNTEGLIGLTHTGTSNFIKFQSLDERAIVQGEQAEIIGDTSLLLDVAGSNTEILIKDSLIRIGYLADDPTPVKLLAINSNREIVETDVSGGGGDNWGSQVVVSDATLSGDGTAGSPLGVANDLNGIISALPLGDVTFESNDNNLRINQSNGNSWLFDFGGANGPTSIIGNLVGGPTTTVDATQLYAADANGNNSTYGNQAMQISSQNSVVNPALADMTASDITLRQANGNAAGNRFPEVNLFQYGDGYPRIRFASGDDDNNDQDLFNTSPILSGGVLGAIEFFGQDDSGDASSGNLITHAAGIQATAQENFTTTQTGARLEFFTTAVGGTGVNSSMILEDDGRLRLSEYSAAANGNAVKNIQLDNAGYLINTSAIVEGSVTASTSASGEITITHGIGDSPTYAHMVIESNATPYFVTLVSTTTTQATFKVWDASTGASVNSTSVTGSWLVK